MPQPLYGALASFFGRLASSDDPQAHENAALQLQRDLQRIKIQSDKSNRPTDAATPRSRSKTRAPPVAR